MIGKRSERKGPIEPRWPAGVAVIAIGGLYAALPSALIVMRPRWLILVIVAVILIPTIISHRTGNHFLNQILGYVLNGFVTVAMMMALFRLLSAVTAHTIEPKPLLLAAAACGGATFWSLRPGIGTWTRADRSSGPGRPVIQTALFSFPK